MEEKDRSAGERQRLLKPPMKAETRKYLLQFYRKEIENLEKFIKKDLSSWK